MTIRLLLISSLLFACGGGSKKQPTTEPIPDKTATAPVAEPVEKAPAEKAPPAEKGPRLALGEVKITLKIKTKKDTGEGEFTIAADGTFKGSATSVNEKKKKETKTKVGKITAAGELVDDQNKTLAKIGDDNHVSVLFEMEHRENGKLIKTDSNWNDVGVLDPDGTFTSTTNGTKISIGTDGKLVGFPVPEMNFTVTAAPEQKRLALFAVIAMLAGGKAVSDGSGAVSAPAVAPTKN